ncbi:MAG: glycosyltransferase family 1 protein [Actinobacteria bacterium]|nr:glycosyltransferase family 1 protein [Actinomycetota bacterium]
MAKVLLAHVFYRRPGGEDAVVMHEAELMRSAGLEVEMLELQSKEFDSLSMRTRATIAASNGDHEFGRSLMSRALKRFDADVVHFHNLYPLIGHGAMAEAAAAGCAVVETLHNYRTSCVAGTHERRGAICEDCTVRRRGPGVLRRCYRGSFGQSLAMARAMSGHWNMLAAGSVPHRVLCLTEFQARRLIASGADGSRLLVKPNSVAGYQGDDYGDREGACCVARVSSEKGIVGLVHAWSDSACPITVCGDGPQLAEATRLAGRAVKVVGPVENLAARRVMASSRVAVVSSVWFEVLPLALLEALAAGTPVVCFDVGELGEVVRRVDSRLVLPVGDFDGLAGAACWVAGLDRRQWERLSDSAKTLYERVYSDAVNVERLLGVYAEARRAHSGSATNTGEACEAGQDIQ